MAAQAVKIQNVTRFVFLLKSTRRRFINTVGIKLIRGWMYLVVVLSYLESFKPL